MVPESMNVDTRKPVTLRFGEEEVGFETVVKALAHWAMRGHSLRHKQLIWDEYAYEAVREVLTEEILSYGRRTIANVLLRKLPADVLSWAIQTADAFRAEAESQ